MMIKFYSSYSYRDIRESKFAILPSETTLYKFMVPRREVGISQTRLAELSNLAKTLPEDEREVSVVFDEMALQANINFDSSGEVFGFAINYGEESQQLATSMLCFLVQGLRRNFHEVAAFYPVHNVDASFLRIGLLEVIRLLMKSGFQPLLTVSDNHPMNQKLYRILSGKSDEELIEDPVIQNPYDSNKPIVLSHDPVHILKCLRNNWFRKPTWPIEENGSISWKLLQALLDHEQDMVIRKAHNLTYRGK